MDLDKAPGLSSHGWQVEPCDLTELKQVMTRWQRELEGRSWKGVGVTNHDPKRTISRFGDDWLTPQ